MKKQKILFVDNVQMKTTKHIYKWMCENYDVMYDGYFNPLKAQTADVIWVEWCETMMQDYSKRNAKDIDLVSDHKKVPPANYDWSQAKLINRAIDIDIYYNHYRGVKWGNVNYLTYIAKHMFKFMDSNLHFAEAYPDLKTMHIPLGIDLKEYEFKKRTRGKNIAFVHHLWTGKGIPLALQLIKMLVDKDPEWKLFIVGDWSNEAWHPHYITHMIKELGLETNVTIQGRVSNVKEFLDKMNYILSTSYKEAFSLIIAEGMAMGLKPIIHNWLGAKDIWGDKWVWNTLDEAVNLIMNDYNSQEYRDYVEQYDIKYEIAKVKEIIEA